MAAAVARRLQKSRLRKAVMYGARTGSEVLRRLRPMYGTPKALSATKLDAIIRATTVGPGGKGRRNVRHVVDEYIRELGHDPFDPAPPFSRKK
jgi:hypothetical protein